MKIVQQRGLVYLETHIFWAQAVHTSKSIKRVTHPYYVLLRGLPFP